METNAKSRYEKIKRENAILMRLIAEELKRRCEGAPSWTQVGDAMETRNELKDALVSMLSESGKDVGKIRDEVEKKIASLINKN